jgi:hypothetical protein
MRAMKFRTTPNFRHDQNLVADQPGRMVFFSGFFAALIIGLLFRGLTTPQRVQSLIAEAATKIHKDVDVHFESAEVSLSHNGFPRLAVIVHKVEMSSMLKCWSQPVLKAEEIILPVSMISLIFERQPFKKIKATDVDLHFRSVRGPCENPVEIKEKRPESQQAVTLVNRRKDLDVSVNPSIDRLEIDKLRLEYDPAPQSAIEVIDLNLEVKSHQPKLIHLEAKTHLMRDNIFQDYVSHGQVQIEYKEFPEQEIMVQFFGNWREGNYSLNADYKFEDTTLISNAELKHIPASQVISALKNYGWLRDDLDGRKIWVTMKGHSQGRVSQWEKIPLAINDVFIEGDLGEIQVDEFQSTNMKPFVFKPMQARVKKLSVDRLLEFLKRPRSLNFIGNLGEFNGRLELIDENEIRLSGRHTGMEFIFANRGQREIQKIASMDGELRMKQNRWSLSLNDIVLDKGHFIGDFKLSADREFKNIEAHLTSEDLTLAPSVQRLMTGGGEMASVKSQIQAQIQGGHLQMLKGSAKLAELEVVDLKNENLGLQMGSQNLRVAVTSPAYPTLKKIMSGDGGNQPIVLKNLNGHFELNSQQELHWKNLAAVLDTKPIKLVSQGQWDGQGLLSGQVLVRGASANSKWSISGHRDQPQVMVTP